MENTFVKLLQQHRAAVAETLREADRLAADAPEYRFGVYFFDDGDARILRTPAEAEEPDLTEEPCVRVGSFCYRNASAPAGDRDYGAIVDNCIVVLHHYR